MGPIFWWVTLILAGFVVCFCLVVILRKQWVESERLDYPLLAPVLEMVAETRDSSGRSGWPILFSGVSLLDWFWAGIWDYRVEYYYLFLHDSSPH